MKSTHLFKFLYDSSGLPFFIMESSTNSLAARATDSSRLCESRGRVVGVGFSDSVFGRGRIRAKKNSLSSRFRVKCGMASAPPRRSEHKKLLSPLLASFSLSKSMSAFLDRKSTCLNSSHRCISYAVFCLKKKKILKSIQH